MNYFEQGQYDTYRQLGLEKTAVNWGWLKGFKPTWAGTKKLFIGEPKKFWNEIRTGTLFSPNSLIRKSWAAPSLLEKLIWWGVPGWQAVQIASSGSPHTTSELGQLAGETLAFNALFRPVGVLGSAVAGLGMGALGKQIGKLIEPKKPKIRDLAEYMGENIVG